MIIVIVTILSTDKTKMVHRLQPFQTADEMMANDSTIDRYPVNLLSTHWFLEDAVLLPL